MNENIFPVEIKTLKLDMRRLEIYYPQVYGLENIYVEDKINDVILEVMYNQINQQGYYDNPETQITGTWELKNNQKGILSLTLINYAFSGGAHGLTIVKGLTFDIETGKLYELPELFKPGSDYIKVLSEEVKEQIEDRDIQTLGEFEHIKPNQDFYIADLSLTIFFQEYEIAPYVYGILYFPISIYEIEDIIDENGPLGRMIS
ncbi:DUF3298 and DUF4163 domain-containing protein [Tissierella carlieri]|jgi:hypothetical protein|uniref:DUF3298 and DUF4163 domain-containing protein n=1 Tax=Tissierella TaxID=41273 RepID=UPI000B9FAA5D|nr:MULTISPECIES: DUF3298 and DUF4163 domain-containing protein [Tissierella]MBU5311684.1 DUF3298 and DUF4163 domain-containing protein [Tissierella carlieri]OZV12201.1 hypothetical protein CIW83_10270 [Tissierella sp. P1]